MTAGNVLVDARGQAPIGTQPVDEPSVPVYTESIGGALIDSARISVMAARSLLPNSAPIVLSPLEDEGPTLHDCLDQAMQWLDAARIQTIERGAPLTSLHTVTASENKTPAGKCIRCGCTDDHQCDDGCWWASTNPPICSRCV